MTIRLSASGIKDYLKCPKMYYFRKQGTPQEETEAMLVGTLAHRIIQRTSNFKDAQEVTKAVLDGIELSTEGEEKLNISIRNTFTNPLFAPYSKIGDSELQFEYPLDKDWKVSLVGTIDRVISEGGKNIIVDWKTSTSYPKNAQRDVQAIIYSWYYWKEFGYSPKFIFAYIYGGDIVTYDRNTSEHESELLSEIIPDMVNNIENENYPKLGMFGSACYNCRFKGVCIQG